MLKRSLLMAAFQRRGLTVGEIEVARAMYGDDVDWARVRIVQMPPFGFWAMAPMKRTILYARLRAWCDFTKAPAHDRGVFVHELAHVWQASRGVVLVFAKLTALGRKAYEYEAFEGAEFAAYNIESQAEIARHLYLAREGAPEKGAPPRMWLEEVWASR